MNPGKLFLRVWAFSIFLFFLNIGTEIVPASFESLCFLIISILIFYFFSESNCIIHFSSSENKYIENIKNIRLVSGFFFLILIVEVIYEFRTLGTLPFLASYTFENVTYNDTGEIFKFRHNIFVKANSIFLSGYYFFLYIFFNKKKYLIIYLIVVLTSLLYLTRSTMISMVIVTLFSYLFYKKITRKQILYSIVLLLASFYIFNQLFYLRNNNNVNFYVISSLENKSVFKSILNGAEEVYTYIASPISNLLYNIDIGTFDIINFRPSYIIRAFMPAGLSNFLFGEVDFKDIVVFPKNANTFSAFASFYFAFGLAGSIFSLILISLICRIVYIKACIKPYKWFLPLLFINHMIVLSIFSTSFTNTVYLFPIVISIIFPPVKLNKAILNANN